MGHAGGEVGFLQFYGHRHLDLGGTDELYVYAVFCQRREELGCHAAMASHANTHDGHLGDAVVRVHFPRAHFFQEGLHGLFGAVGIVQWHGKGQVRYATAPYVLDDHVHIYVGIGQRLKHLGGCPGPIGQLRDNDLYLVLVERDTAYDDIFHGGDFFFHDCSGIIVKATAHFKYYAKLLGKFHRAGLHDL